MTQKNFTDVTILLDRSGSMECIRDGTIESVNGFIESQKEVPGDGCWTLIQFDNQYEVNYAQVKEDSVKPLSRETYSPRGGTCLLGALGTAIKEKGEQLAAMPENQRPSTVLFVVITDGEENNSHACEWSKGYSHSRVMKMVAHQQEKYSWKFLYLGANQDAIAVGNSYGFAKGHSTNYCHTNAGIVGALRGTSGTLRNWKLDGNKTGQQLLSPIDPQVNVNVAVGVK